MLTLKIFKKMTFQQMERWFLTIVFYILEEA